MVCLLRQGIVIQRLGRLSAAEDAQDGGPRLRVRGRHEQDTIEAPGTAKRAIQVPWRVGGRQYKYAVIGVLDAVQFSEELVDKLPGAAVTQV